MREPLHEDEELEVDFGIEEETDRAFVEIRTDAVEPDLSVEDAVVVAVGGTIAELEIADPNRARARLGSWPDIEREGLELMIRVGEWFERWELE
ncbi:MAG: hypothetical protein ABEL76_03510 [Bradymonadaceae bacterium]